MRLNPSYPNLELLEYKVKENICKDKMLVEKLNEFRKKHSYASFKVIVFPQTWATTCTGFDVAADGSPAFGGCAITNEYTSVFHEELTDTYVVCFGDRPCYMVTDATDEFFEDLRKRDMASLSKAKKRY